MTRFIITITSDTMCPWCYIGFAPLQQAIRVYTLTYPGARLNDSFDIQWRPYYLREPPTDTTKSENPASCSSAIDEVILERFASSATRATSAQVAIQRAGAAVGLKFTFAGRIGPTRDSHRLLRFARQLEENSGEAGIQTRLAVAFFEFLWQQGGDITVQTELCRIAAEIGVGKYEDLLTRLQSDEAIKDVDAQAYEAKQEARGVPRFVVRVDGDESNVVKKAGDGEASGWLEIFAGLKEKRDVVTLA